MYVYFSAPNLLLPFTSPFPAQRSPTPSSGSPDPSISSEDGSCQSPTRFRSFSESFFTVKGAAIVLPRSECVRHITASATSGSSIQVREEDSSQFYVPIETKTVAIIPCSTSRIRVN